MAITPRERMRIAVRAECCEKTVRHVYAGRGTEYTRVRVERAAEDLGLPTPPPQPERDDRAA